MVIITFNSQLSTLYIPGRGESLLACIVEIKAFGSISFTSSFKRGRSLRSAMVKMISFSFPSYIPRPCKKVPRIPIFPTISSFTSCVFCDTINTARLGFSVWNISTTFPNTKIANQEYRGTAQSWNTSNPNITTVESMTIIILLTFKFEFRAITRANTSVPALVLCARNTQVTPSPKIAPP